MHALNRRSACITVQHAAEVTDLLSYWKLIRTGVARPFIVPRFSGNDKQVCAVWAKEHGGRGRRVKLVKLEQTGVNLDRHLLLQTLKIKILPTVLGIEL